MDGVITTGELIGVTMVLFWLGIEVEVGLVSSWGDEHPTVSVKSKIVVLTIKFKYLVKVPLYSIYVVANFLSVSMEFPPCLWDLRV